MTIRLYNTLTREKDVFSPIDPDNVRMYVCGPTVYDFAHIGNARPVIVFDVLFRLLRYVYGASHVTYARNVTDVDDKINDRAVKDFPGVAPLAAIRELTEKTYRQFSADITELRTLPPTVEPRATETIAEMIGLIDKLIASGHAYAAEGHVLFAVGSMADYGQLANRSLDEMLAGARVDVAPYKRDAMDFVLWKPSDAQTEPGWNSPWGYGRPGWHLECSAMSWKHLGETFDIHGGGIDLVFPHHENEIAQSRCAHGTPVMARYWLHNGFLQVEGEKMSKSLGNFFTIRELLNDWPGEVLRLAMLRAHYRQPIDFTIKSLEEARRTLDDWYWFARDGWDARPATSIIEALSDDLNTPKAIAELHALRNAAQKAGGEAAHGDFVGSLRFLGFLGETAESWDARRKAAAGIDANEVERLVALRLEARNTRNFAESDRLRDVLAEMGVSLKDAKDARTGRFTTSWEVKG
ncbi:MAG: cysteine--tRNA ligase [Ancalomicrobiaceae bacterium]|nr:cysteine--tRNA ligase [Ancalomicrobiaceae bacterium]